MKRLSSIAGEVLLLLCTLAMIWGGIGIYLHQEHARALEDAETRTANLARAFEETVGRSIALLDQALEHVRDVYIRDPDHFSLNDWLRDKKVLRGISVQISVADAGGHIVATTVAGAPLNVSIADREHFTAHLPPGLSGSPLDPGDRLFISKPVIGRASELLSVQLSRRVIALDGHFAGVVVASLDPHVLGIFRRASTLGDGFTLLAGTDGIVRSARPDASLIGTSILPTANDAMARMFEPEASDGTETAITDDAIVSYRGVSGYNLFVAAGISRSTAFASYERARRYIVLAGGFLSLIGAFVGSVTIRQRYRLERFHQALNMTLDNVSQGIIMIDPRRHMPVVNRRVAELLGLPPELAVQDGSFDALLRWLKQRGEFRTELTGDDRIGAMVNDGGIDPGLTVYERVSGDGTVLEVRTTVLPDGGAVRTFTDVTERKRIEREIVAARDAAQAGERARTEFLAVMSHEIRTPMNGVVGASGLLLDLPLDAEQREYVRVIHESSEHLSSLIQNILDFARLEAGGWELDEITFDPRTLINGTIEMLTRQAQLKNLTLVATIGSNVPAMVFGDPSRLRQVLVNLIGNGIKFTQAGGVLVNVEALGDDEQSLTLGFAVTDTGIGIDRDSQEKLFSAFSQVDSSTSRRFGGTGLGLAICKHLVTLMGGTIAVESVPAHGSTFRFTMRSRRVDPGLAIVRPEQGGQRSRPLQVLLAEDNPTNRYVAIRMLTRLGHTVDAVENGAEAIKAATSMDYDVILMDIMMPEVDGIEATRAIRASMSPRRDIVIVGLTANALPSDRAACEAAGMNDFVTKPVTLERLRGALEQVTVTLDGPMEPAKTVDALTLDSGFLRQLAMEIGLESAAELVRVFLEDAPARMATIRAAMAEGAIRTVRFEAHAMAGAARNVGLTRLGKAADILRRATEAAGPDAAAIELVANALDASTPLAAAWADAHQRMAETSS